MENYLWIFWTILGAVLIIAEIFTTGFVLLWFVVLLPAAARAQSSGAGAIAGVVRDTSGAVIPGVIVEAASPALIDRVRSVVSDERGLYFVMRLQGANQIFWPIFYKY